MTLPRNGRLDTVDDASPLTLAQQFRSHFGHRDHLYGELLARLAADLEEGGPTLDICRHHLDAPRGDAIQLRLLAGIFRIVLRGEAPELERFYPSLGGTAPADQAWPALRPVLDAHAAELRTALDHAPQTNEVGRSACLLVALFEAVRRHGTDRVRLLEPGASAGLNLLVDRYRFTGDGWAWGPEASPLVLDTGAAGLAPREFDVVERRGCDLSPVDASTPEGARYLTSFVWPFDVDRHARLAAALTIAREHPVTVDRASAESWLDAQLRRPVGDGVLTVVWQSITQQYWPAATSAAVAEVVADARSSMPLAHVTMEGVPPAQPLGGYSVPEHGPELRLDGDLLARSHHHGPPVLLR
jgi:hypothetical protein